MDTRTFEPFCGFGDFCSTQLPTEAAFALFAHNAIHHIVRSTFTVRRLYTAWDNLGDEERFFRGVDTLERHGIHPRNLSSTCLSATTNGRRGSASAIASTAWSSATFGLTHVPSGSIRSRSP
jgi:hypothetical protein